MQFPPKFVAAVAALLSAGTVNAHMKIGSPTPFNPGSLNNSPLDASGADFPCKFGESYTPGARVVPPENVYAIGETQTLSFIGSAVHGGGSCQLSLTQDPIPNKKSVWKVIHSIEGGCPASADGNLPANPDGHGASVFHFKIPSSIAPGEYTFAWSWLNRIGNREFYMNCAPITVTGGKKRRYTPTPRSETSKVALAKRQDLPEMFVANINSCHTTEGYDIIYPEPGTSLERDGVPSNLAPMDKPICVLPDGQKIMPGSGGNPGYPAPGPSPTPSPYPSPSPSLPQPATTPLRHAQSPPPAVSPGNFATVSQVIPGPSSAPVSPPPAPAPAPGANPPPSNNSGSGMSGACSNEGEWNCIGGTQFQRCASGQWTPVMAVAAGTQCTSDAGTFAITAAKKKRDHVAKIHRRRGHS
ncbi:conserved hypothetical protein [Histoplasma capsulatum G186AR]|uniref:Endoglucanase n=2 Tax=Ajellomyces capsulatus TaxID=5037 RepID=C0NTG4_AJECG|nr:uncharacterized protein HCBG_06444 [Histoplasma capsulatum G186AR]EEH05325.1 conserved hypothetical protein [Histoplasma capsulatum G186AR]KAG5305302.1 hypothetical protein I7I52_03916 [Histoplasma capsulatum]QSS76263.1 hypothetical protein I7I50_05656 [Histoplasma capsulatum G186AR]